MANESAVPEDSDVVWNENEDLALLGHGEVQEALPTIQKRGGPLAVSLPQTISKNSQQHADPRARYGIHYRPTTTNDFHR